MEVPAGGVPLIVICVVLNRDMKPLVLDELEQTLGRVWADTWFTIEILSVFIFCLSFTPRTKS